MADVEDQKERPAITGFEIIRVLGKGGMSVVYEARNIGLDEIVAVKIVCPEALGSIGMQRFRKESQRLAALDHANIVKVRSAGFAQTGEPYIAMEYLKGRSLAAAFEQDNLSPEQFEKVILDVLSALEYAHANRIIHRDIKPGNVVLIDADDRVTAKLVDFGLAKAADPAASQKLTGSEHIIGTPLYMSPEQCGGRELDFRTDLYSLACVIYEYLYKQPPFTGDSPLEVMYQKLNGSVSIPGECGASMRMFLQRALATDASRRPKDAAEFRAGFIDSWSGRHEGSGRKAGAAAAVSLLAGIVGGVIVAAAAADFAVSVQPVVKPMKNKSAYAHLIKLEKEANASLERGMTEEAQGDHRRAEADLANARVKAAQVCRGIRRRQMNMHAICAKLLADKYLKDPSNTDLRDQAEAEWSAARDNALSVWPDMDTKEFGEFMIEWSRGRSQLGYLEGSVLDLKKFIEKVEVERKNAAAPSISLMRAALQEAENAKRTDRVVPRS